MPWKTGDLGRFTSESDAKPRFEVLGLTEDRSAVQVWYGGQAEATSVPKATFKRDCVNTWVIKEAIPPRPAWLKEGAEFEFPQNAFVGVRQAEIRNQDGRVSHATNVDLRGRKLQIRRIRWDYASCFALEEKLVVLVPLPIIVRQGFKRMTRWEVIDDTLTAEAQAEAEAREQAELFRDFE